MRVWICVGALLLPGCSQGDVRAPNAEPAGSSQTQDIPAGDADRSAELAAHDGASSPQVIFLGLPEDETSATGPPRSALDVPEITEVVLSDYAAYEAAKAAKRVVAEERHGEWIYWACDEFLCLAMDDGEAIVGITERFKARVPPGD